MLEIAPHLDGVAFTSADAEFAVEAAGFNLATVHEPAIVVGPASERDVSTAVRFAEAHGMAVRVQCTGHGSHVTIRDGMLISTSRLDTLRIDGDVATIGAGVRWRDVIDAAAPLGLAPVTGSSPDVGAVGYLLGGGLGPLARSHGFSSDWLLGARVVVGGGEVVEASPEGDADLYWALRGGKGGLGVVTEVRVRLAPIPELRAGSLTFDGAHLEPVLRGWLDETSRAHPDLTTSLLMIRMPDLEVVPAEVRGRFLVTLRVAFPGPRDEAERLVAPLRALAPVEVDTVRPMPLTEVGSIHADPTDPVPSWGWGAMLDAADDAVADAILAQFGVGVPSPFLALEIRHFGSASTVDVADGSAVGGRGGAFGIFGIGAPVPELFAEALPAAAARLRDALGPWLTAQSNIHFLDHLAGPELFATAWPSATRERLEAVRRRVDPAGTFAFGPH